VAFRVTATVTAAAIALCAPALVTVNRAATTAHAAWSVALTQIAVETAPFALETHIVTARVMCAL